MVLHEIEHVTGNAFQALPAVCDVGSGCISTRHIAYGIIQPHFVIKVIELPLEDVVAVFVRVVYFGNKDEVRISSLDLGNDPSPELHGDHLCHVATESVNAF